jgi:hypothetical protein
MAREPALYTYESGVCQDEELWQCVHLQPFRWALQRQGASEDADLSLGALSLGALSLAARQSLLA